MSNILFLDAQTKKDGDRITSFADTVEDLLRDYQGWVKERGFSQKDIWYANIFDGDSSKHLAKAIILEDAAIEVQPVSNSKVNPYKRSLWQQIQRLL